MKVTTGQLDDARDDLASMGDDYLRERGWNHSSRWPDSCWRWSKKVGDVTHVCTKSGALTLQERMSADLALDKLQVRCDGCENTDDTDACSECESEAVRAS